MKAAKYLFLSFFIASTGLISACSDDEDSATAANGGQSTNNGSLGPSTPTGRIPADGFFVLYDPAVPEVFDETRAYTQQEVIITAFADDINDLAEVNGHIVNFRTEWGQWLDQRDSCVLQSGTCSVTWRSGDPATAPGSCVVAITAWTTGEEAFFDANDNGQFDSTETFTDLEEPFLDIDSSDSFEGTNATVELVAEAIDIINFTGTTPGTKNGQHDPGNNLYDGSLCAAGNASCNTARTSMIIHTRSNILIQQPFVDSDDLDGDGDTTEEIVFCGGNPF